jgi:beta-mannosidase
VSGARSLSLDGVWKLTAGPQTAAAPREPAQLNSAGWLTIPATVPGNVELDLIAAGRLPELSRASNIFLLREFETWDWWFDRSFLTPKVNAGERCELVFDGIDCLAQVWLNGKAIGSTDNMLIAHRFDVTDHLNRSAANELVIRIESTVLASRKRIPEPRESVFPTNYEGQAIRKAPHMFGWDITPRIVSAGMWRSVHLDILGPTRIQSVCFTTVNINLEKKTASALLDWHFITDRLLVDDLVLHIRLMDGPETVYEHKPPIFGVSGRARLELSDISFWWPRGKGDPHLYRLVVDLLDPGGSVLDTSTTRVGIRTIVLDRTDVTSIEKPGEFVFIVNGHKTFALGTNWVPLDCLHSRDPQFLKSTFDLMLDLNCNMVRCWGGNVYEDHAFFDLCDEHGVMVWQDFALACAVYPEDEAFIKSMRIEAEHIVTKLRNHASLALWAGNNEIDEAFEGSGMGVNPNDDHISREVLPRVVQRLDPKRAYLPSSPYHSRAFFEAGGDGLRQSPEQHLWGYRDHFKHDYFYQTAAHFVSEVGYHGCPDRRSLEQFIDADHLWPPQNNDQWLAHATIPHLKELRYGYRIGLMSHQIRHMFGSEPDNLDDFVLASQIFQAECKKFFIERMRAEKWRRTGVLWWNLRDGWPIISDAIVDYYGRKKLAYQYIKRVQQDVCVMIVEGPLRQPMLVAVNETLSDCALDLSVADSDSQMPLRKTCIVIPANGRIDLGQMPTPKAAALWLIRWDGNGIADGMNHFLAGGAPFDFNQYMSWLNALKLPPEPHPHG